MASLAKVLVILDPNYGEQLKDVWPGQAVWITLSPLNEAVVRSLWANHPDHDQLTGITGLRFRPEAAPESVLLAQLNVIDLHHGSYSTDNPYTELEVIGVRLNAAVRKAIARLQFTAIVERNDSFIARKTDVQQR